MIDNINTDHTWWRFVNDHRKQNGVQSTYKAGVSLLSVTDFETYKSKLGVLDVFADTNVNQGASDSGNTVADVYFVRDTNNWGGDAAIVMCGKVSDDRTQYGYRYLSKWANQYGLLRPAFYLKKDFFKTTELDLSKTGEAVLNMMRERYCIEDLADIYSEQELIDRGFTHSYSMQAYFSLYNSTAEIYSLNGATSLQANVTIRSSKTIRGNLSERGAVGTNNEYIKLDGVTYYVAKNYRDSNTNSINLNSVVSISLDPWGKVADISAVSSTGYKIAILKAVAIPNGIDSKGLSMKIFDRDGKMSVYKAIDRVVIDNYRTKDAEDAERVLTEVTGISVYQPIRYILNSDGLIANIDTTYYNESAGESEESLRYIWRSYKNDYTTRGYGTDIQYMYWANKNFGRKFFAGQWMTLMKLPRQDTADDKFFITEAEWVSGRYYYVDALAVGRDNFCADVVIQYYDATEGSTEGQTIRYGLVTDVVYALDDDGGSAYRISYIDAYGGGTRTRFVDSSCSITDAASIKQGDENTYRISEGDFVCFSTDAAEMIAKAEVIYDAETGMWASDLPHIRADRTEGIVNCNMEVNELFHGYVLQNGTSYIRLTGEKPVDVTDSVMDSAYVFRIANSKIYKYDSRRAKLVAVDASEIIPFEYSYADCAEVVTGDLGGLTPFVVIYN